MSSPMQYVLTLHSLDSVSAHYKMQNPNGDKVSLSIDYDRFVWMLRPGFVTVTVTPRTETEG